MCEPGKINNWTKMQITWRFILYCVPKVKLT